MGLSNPYNLNIYMQLLIFSIAAQYFTQRRKENLKVGGIMFGAAVAAFIAINIGSLLYNWQLGKNPAALDRHSPRSGTVRASNRWNFSSRPRRTTSTRWRPSGALIIRPR